MKGSDHDNNNDDNTDDNTDDDVDDEVDDEVDNEVDDDITFSDVILKCCEILTLEMNDDYEMILRL